MINPRFTTAALTCVVGYRMISLTAISAGYSITNTIAPDRIRWLHLSVLERGTESIAGPYNYSFLFGFCLLCAHGKAREAQDRIGK